MRFEVENDLISSCRSVSIEGNEKSNYATQFDVSNEINVCFDKIESIMRTVRDADHAIRHPLTTTVLGRFRGKDVFVFRSNSYGTDDYSTEFPCPVQ